MSNPAPGANLHTGQRTLLIARCVRVPRLVAGLLICVFLLPSAPVLHAQTLSGISGTVTDSSGAVVPAAQVTITNTETGVSRVARTSSEGGYRLTDLNPATYTVKVEKSGFKTSLQSDVTVQAAASSTSNVVLMVGDAREVLAVNASNVALVTEQALLGTTIPSKLLEDLPILSVGTVRQIETFECLAPGVSTVKMTDGAVAKGVTSVGRMSGGLTPGVSTDGRIDGGLPLPASAPSTAPGPPAADCIPGPRSVAVAEHPSALPSPVAPLRTRLAPAHLADTVAWSATPSWGSTQHCRPPCESTAPPPVAPAPRRGAPFVPAADRPATICPLIEHFHRFSERLAKIGKPIVHLWRHGPVVTAANSPGEC